MAALLVFIIATLAEKNCWTQKVHLAITSSKLRLRLHPRQEMKQALLSFRRIIGVKHNIYQTAFFSAHVSLHRPGHRHAPSPRSEHLEQAIHFMKHAFKTCPRKIDRILHNYVSGTKLSPRFIINRCSFNFGCRHAGN